MLLLIIATVRGVYTSVEQPATSTMRFFPDLCATAKRIQEILGVWSEQFLPESQFENKQRFATQLDGNVGKPVCEAQPCLGHCVRSSIPTSQLVNRERLLGQGHGFLVSIADFRGIRLPSSKRCRARTPG